MKNVGQISECPGLYFSESPPDLQLFIFVLVVHMCGYSLRPKKLANIEDISQKTMNMKTVNRGDDGANLRD